ncbi:hypothetical protein [Dyella silvatica]|uniref:hypothetical protein n=1 Tax=Dyella silvatica TaxID=2992128 RepID=UPI00224F0C25|nr:hypothetical protein [Dyella silvatica]
METYPLLDTARADQGDLGIELPLTLSTGRGAPIIGIAIFTLLAGLSLWIYLDGKDWPALACTLLFALLALLFALTARYRATLRIDETGFTLTSPLRKNKAVTTAWRHVEQFGVVNVGRPYVTYQITPSSGRRRIPGGYLLPAFAGMPTPALAALLEACREHFSTS